MASTIEARSPPVPCLCGTASVLASVGSACGVGLLGLLFLGFCSDGVVVKLQAQKRPELPIVEVRRVAFVDVRP